MESLTPPRMFTAAMRARKSGSDRHATCGGGRGAISKSMSSQQHTTLRKIRYGSANCTPFIATGQDREHSQGEDAAGGQGEGPKQGHQEGAGVPTVISSGLNGCVGGCVGGARRVRLVRGEGRDVYT